MRLYTSFAVLLLTVLCTGVRAADLEKIIVALKPDKNPEAMLQERKTLSEFLSKELGGLKVEVIVPLSGNVIAEGLANGTIDLAYVSGTDLVKIRGNKAGEGLLYGELEGKTSYTSIWLVKKEKEYKSIADVKGKPIAFASKTSTSGFTIPLWNLMKLGLVKENGDPQEFAGTGNVFFGTGYVSAVERVLAGDAEAASVSDYVFYKNKHLNDEQKAKLRVLQSQGPVPSHILAVRSSLSAEWKGKLKAALLKLNDGANTELRDKVFTSKIVESNDDAHLSAITEALKMTGQLK